MLSRKVCQNGQDAKSDFAPVGQERESQANWTAQVWRKSKRHSGKLITTSVLKKQNKTQNKT